MYVCRVAYQVMMESKTGSSSLLPFEAILGCYSVFSSCFPSIIYNGVHVLDVDALYCHRAIDSWTWQPCTVLQKRSKSLQPGIEPKVSLLVGHRDDWSPDVLEVFDKAAFCTGQFNSPTPNSGRLLFIDLHFFHTLSHGQREKPYLLKKGEEIESALALLLAVLSLFPEVD